MAELMEMNTVKYSAYRLALKLRRVQQRLCLDLLDLEAAVLGFDMHGLTPDRHDMAIEIPEMVLILYSIYETLDQEEPEEIEVSVARWQILQRSGAVVINARRAKHIQSKNLETL